jgi:outer membrane putative beta-barrel porin/alpha-amylase
VFDEHHTVNDFPLSVHHRVSDYMKANLLTRILVIGFFVILASPIYSMELAPLRWSHLPLGANFAGIGFVSTEADIFIDPDLQLEDVELKLDSWAGKYIRTFELFDKSARIGLIQAYQEGEWTGLLGGVPATARRAGLSDTLVRLAVNLYGAPPLSGKEFAQYRANADVETIVGVALAMRLPTGDYLEDKLMNLGENRFVFRPQLGITHKRGKWTTELTGEVAFHMKNDEFFNGNTRRQDPLYFLHGHLIHTFKPGVWVSASVGYNYGGESSINGVDSDNKKKNLGWALSFAQPIGKTYRLKIAYIGVRTQEDIGLDSDTLTAGLSLLW